MPYYRQLAEIPVPTSGSFVAEDTVQILYSIRDHTNKSNRTISKTVFIPQGESPPVSTPVSEQRNVVSSAYSPSRAYFAVLREDGEGQSAKRWVEVWNKDHLVVSQEVTKLHGKFYTDDAYAALDFSPSENALVYVAEAEAPENTEDDPYLSFRYTPELGEGLAGRRRPTVYYFRWEACPSTKDHPNPLVFISSVSLSSPPATPTLLGQATFISDGKIAATGYEQLSDGRLLGVKFCPNRPAGIWTLDIPTVAMPTASTKECKLESLTCSATKTTSKELSCRSPRPHDSQLYWLSCEIGGPHASCAALHSMDTKTRTSKTLVERVWEPEDGQFPGLYLDFNLPKQTFLQLKTSEKFIATQSTWGSRTVILLISLKDGSVKNLTENKDNKFYSWKLLSTDGKNRVLCIRSYPASPPEVVLGTIDENKTISWQVLDKPYIPAELAKSLSKIETSIVPIPNRPRIETIVVRSSDNGSPNTPPPCITIPHGGPHGATSTAFSPALAARILSGYTVSMPNFTGSTGFGQKHIKDLIGNIGSLDVEDCVASVKHLASVGISSLGAGRQYIQGGSHGGFLTGHLIGQYPDIFTAAVLRNPVISVGEISISDIPDWYYEECGLPYTSTSLMKPDIYKKLYDASPISFVDKVKTPTLLMVGESDLRVAPTQGIGYYHALKGRGQTVEMLWFPKEAHGLEGVEASMINLEAELSWFRKYKG